MVEFLLGLLVGFLLGVYIAGNAMQAPFDGEYDKAVYEWQKKKYEKQ